MGTSFPQKKEATPGKSCVLRQSPVSTQKPIPSISPLSTSTSLLLTCPFSYHLCIYACSSPSPFKKNTLHSLLCRTLNSFFLFSVKLSQQWGQSLLEAVSSSLIHCSTYHNLASVPTATKNKKYSC